MAERASATVAERVPVTDAERVAVAERGPVADAEWVPFPVTAADGAAAPVVDGAMDTDAAEDACGV
ncbi:hypothetical protein E3E14_05405 [Streptomyces sp. ICN441]|nr:hypothetical protein E3E14_05405 [Streptomyces sp. ICN441]